MHSLRTPTESLLQVHWNIEHDSEIEIPTHFLHAKHSLPLFSISSFFEEIDKCWHSNFASNPRVALAYFQREITCLKRMPAWELKFLKRNRGWRSLGRGSSCARCLTRVLDCGRVTLAEDRASQRLARWFCLLHQVSTLSFSSWKCPISWHRGTLAWGRMCDPLGSTHVTDYPSNMLEFF